MKKISWNKKKINVSFSKQWSHLSPFVEMEFIFFPFMIAVLLFCSKEWLESTCSMDKSSLGLRAPCAGSTWERWNHSPRCGGEEATWSLGEIPTVTGAGQTPAERPGLRVRGCQTGVPCQLVIAQWLLYPMMKQLELLLWRMWFLAFFFWFSASWSYWEAP